MADFETAVKIVLRHEGGLFENKETKEFTNRGISLALIKRLVQQKKTTFGIEPTEDGIRTLTEEQAKKIYKEYFWDWLKLGGINDQRVANKIFDIAVNMGPDRPVKMAQKVVGRQPNGRCHQSTIDAINAMDAEEFLKGFIGELEDRYVLIVEKAPVNRKFLAGWLARAREIA